MSGSATAPIKSSFENWYQEHHPVGSGVRSFFQTAVSLRPWRQA